MTLRSLRIRLDYAQLDAHAIFIGNPSRYLPNGVYLVEVVVDGEMSVKEVIKP
jgi:hypothetical protein